MKIEIAPGDGIEKYEREMRLIYSALQKVMDFDFSGALVTDESYITDFLTFRDKTQRNKECKVLEEILGVPLDNPSLIYICRMIRIKAGA